MNSLKVQYEKEDRVNKNGYKDGFVVTYSQGSSRCTVYGRNFRKEMVVSVAVIVEQT